MDGIQCGKRKLTDNDERSRFPKLRVIDQNRTMKQTFKMAFIAKRDNAGVTITARPLKIHFALKNIIWNFDLEVSQDNVLKIDRGICIYLRMDAGANNPVEWPLIEYANHWKISTSIDFLFSKPAEDGSMKKDGEPFRVEDCVETPKAMQSFPPAAWLPLIAIPDESDLRVEGLRTVLGVEMEFNITNMFGFRKRANFLYEFTEPNQDSDLVFKFGEDNVYINSTFLSFHSEYFSALRDRLSELEKDENGFPFQKMNGEKEEFIELMQMVYPSTITLTDENISFILPLADRFLFEGILTKCEQFLGTETSTTDIFLKLFWSSEYNMNDLQEWCLRQFTRRAALEKVTNSDVYKKLSAQVLRSIIVRMGDLK